MKTLRRILVIAAVLFIAAACSKKPDSGMHYMNEGVITGWDPTLQNWELQGKPNFRRG